MATYQLTSVLSGTIELPKYIQIGVCTEIWALSLTTPLLLGDSLLGPTIPAGVYLDNVRVDTAQLDSGNLIAFEVGYVGSLAAFIGSGNTTARLGGLVGANVAGTVGATFATNTQVVLTITTAPSVFVPGRLAISCSYTASP